MKIFAQPKGSVSRKTLVSLVQKVVRKRLGQKLVDAIAPRARADREYTTAYLTDRVKRLLRNFDRRKEEIDSHRLMDIRFRDRLDKVNQRTMLDTWERLEKEAKVLVRRQRVVDMRTYRQPLHYIDVGDR